MPVDDMIDPALLNEVAGKLLTHFAMHELHPRRYFSSGSGEVAKLDCNELGPALEYLCSASAQFVCRDFSCQPEI